MKLTRLQIRNVRILEAVDIRPQAGLNYFIGDNGAGKTSLLEGIFALSSGGTFRNQPLKQLINRQSDYLQVHAKLQYLESGDSHNAGLQRGQNGDLRIKFDSQPLNRLAQLSHKVPLLALHPESHLLVTGGPSVRRKALDWGLFHVEPSFMATWREYKRALEQRNAALKLGMGNSSIQLWHQPLANSGEAIHRHRQAYLEDLLPVLRQYLTRVDWGGGVNIELRRGWPSNYSLLDELSHGLHRDKLYKTTHSGPHRADLIFKYDSQEIKHHLSRGQQKLLVYFFRLAQAQYIYNKRKVRSVFLCDDLPAEFDRSMRAMVCQQLIDLGHQLFATSVDDLHEEFSALQSAVFHVKHGLVEQVV